MKNSITQFSLVIIAFVALSLLMSYTRPVAEEPKQYIIITYSGGSPATPARIKENIEKTVNDKLAEGWRLQGGVSPMGSLYCQAMVK